jgi:alpha-D-ribose 1-methylphosphonate 5-triphosphate diphosphatase
VATVSAVPAETAGLADRGRIEPGLKADLLRVAVIEGQPIVKTVWRDAKRVM